MSAIWAQGRGGRRVDMLDPSRNTYDFKEMCATLARINRYNGQTEDLTVSVAYHTIIGAKLAPIELRPWWLLHDFHEYVMGDIIKPTEWALVELGGPTVKKAIAELKHRHDVAIHAAAGLPLPTFEQKTKIREIDVLTCVTEHTQFMATPPEPWVAPYNVDPDIRYDWREAWMQPEQCAAKLLQLCRACLPVFYANDNTEAA